MTESTRRCSGVLARSYRWSKKGSGYFLTTPETTSNRCNQCSTFEECMKSTLKQAYPTANYNEVNIYVNLKPIAEIFDHVQQENAEVAEKTEEAQME